MTAEDEQLEGRMLDAAVAEHLFGYQWLVSESSGLRGLFKEPPAWFKQKATGREGLCKDWDWQLKAYSTDPAFLPELLEVGRDRFGSALIGAHSIGNFIMVDLLADTGPMMPTLCRTLLKRHFLGLTPQTPAAKSTEEVAIAGERSELQATPLDKSPACPRSGVSAANVRQDVEHDLGELLLNLSLNKPIWPNQWCQDVGAVAHEIYRLRQHVT